MYLTSTLKRTLAIAGTSLLAVVGLVGWTRDSGSRAVAPSQAPNWYSPPAAPVDADRRVVYAPSPFGSDAPVSRAIHHTGDPEPIALASAAPAAQAAPRRNYRRTSAPRRHVVVKKRPFKRSAAIVAGSAGAGAAIGALAGGGKGAAIGALAGGGGGLVYDRATHKKKVVVR